MSEADPPGSRHPPGADTPPGRDPPRADTPRADTPQSRPPWKQTLPQEQTPPPGADSPLGADTPHPPTPHSRHPPGPDAPPREADSSIRSTSGRYASYWNAFLFGNENEAVKTSRHYINQNPLLFLHRIQWKFS